MNFTRLLCHIISAVAPVLVQGAIVAVASIVLLSLVVWFSLSIWYWF